MGAALEDVGEVRAGRPGDEDVESPELEAAQEKYEEAAKILRKAKKPLLKASEDLATFNSALAAAILAGQLTPEQKEEAVEARIALATPFGERVTRFVKAYRTFTEAQRELAEAEGDAAQNAEST